ncbi:sialidase-1-like [Branchiostoma floridae]|uniref:Sialidase-1 n=1 Tax=Branchiostoma floridae TaxID=7739 RepID=A0A9J7LNT0_BRAFL|nr:sialidase-1-like [Branchiostoma floridae]
MFNYRYYRLVSLSKKHAPAKGRLIVCGHGFQDGLGLVLLLSDDHGVTWRHGAFVPSVPYQNNTDGDFNPDECQLVELPDGSLYLVVRNQHQYKYHCKMTMRSFDGGETLPRRYMFLDRSLVEPKITSGLWYHNGTMFYSGPKSETERKRLHIRWSHDYGHTWTSGTEIWGDLAGYSTLTMLPHDRNHLYILYERGIRKYFDEVAFTKIKLSMESGRNAL